MKRWKQWLGVVCAVALVLCAATFAFGGSARAAEDATAPMTEVTEPAEEGAVETADEAAAEIPETLEGEANEQASEPTAEPAPATSPETAAENGIDLMSESGVQFDRISLEIGATESARNFNWMSTSTRDGYVQVALMPEGWKDGDAFPEDATFVDNVQAEKGGSERESWNSYKASVSGLSANTSYIYRVGNGTDWSEAYGFTTGDFGATAPFSFMFAGDPQIGASGDAASDTEGWTNTLNTMMAAFPETDFMISLGDQINASNPETVEGEYEGFFAPDVLHDITLATNVGNHETGANNQHYSYNYNMPNRSTYGAVDSTGSASGDYWFTYNGVLFMSLNSNDQNTAEHKAFMEDAIAANPDANWKIVTFHHSVYSVANHTTDEDILARRSTLPAVFSDLDIDAVLMGHDHVYTRTYLMDGTTPVEGSGQDVLTDPADGQVLYITANSASGSKYYNIKDDVEKSFSYKEDQSQRENMTLVNVTEDSLTFTTYFTDDAQVTDGDVLDKVTIQRTGEPVEPEQPQVDRVSLEIGATETSRNFNWVGTTTKDAMVQVAVKPADWQSGDAFPTDAVITAAAEASGSEREGWSSFKATVNDLEGNTSYLYRVGNDGCWSETYKFEIGNVGEGASFSFMFAGDPQIGASGDAASDTEGWTNTLDLMVETFPETDFLISAGDQINSGDPSTVEEEYAGFFAPEILHDITLATNVGNHETYADNQNYSYNYNMPNRSELGAVDSTGDASGDYWYTYNGVLFMSINSNNMSTSEHRAFMEDAIAKNPDANWKIVTFHHSVYSVADHTQDSDILQRRSELPVVFSDLGIDLVLMGHDHVYTRTYLMDGTTPVEGTDGDVLTNPESGEVLYVTANSASGSKYYEIQNLPQNTFSAVQDQSHRQNMTLVNVSDDALTVSTYYTDGDSIGSEDLLDQVSIKRAADSGQQGTGENNPGTGNQGTGNQGTGNQGTATTKPAGTTGSKGGSLPSTGDTLAAPVTVAAVAAAGLAALAVRSVIVSRRKNN